MAFKFVILSAVLAVASAGYITSVPSHYAAPSGVVTKVVNPSMDAVAQTHQNVVRSFGGTVSHYSKSVQTPYSSVHKEDTRVNNNVYTPKTVTYTAAPATVTKTVYHGPEIHEEQQEHVYAAPAPTAAVYTHQTPVYTPSTPAVSAYAHPAPTAAVYTHSAPAATTVYSHPAPTAAVYTYATPSAAVYHQEVPSTATTSYNHGPAATTYSHNGHGVSGYGSSQTVHYSPAEMVSHMSFDGFGTHWGY